jgi:exodeoxyribonuclease VII large subunit
MRLDEQRIRLATFVMDKVATEKQEVAQLRALLLQEVEGVMQTAKDQNVRRAQLLAALSPETALKRGYAILRSADGKVLKSGKSISAGDKVRIQLTDARISAEVREVSQNA